MREMTEQEALARLVSSQNAEPIDTGDMLAEGLKSSLSGSLRYQADIESKNQSSDHSGYSVTAQEPTRNLVSEKLLITLYEIRDNLITMFSKCELNSDISESLSDEINRLGDCIVYIGGDVEDFDPLSYASGLDTPDAVKNAEEVLKRTIQCYKLGEIKEAKIQEDGKEILIVFAGKNKETTYQAKGRIIAKSWTGNEAIDYVYSPRSGKMSVKSFEGGKWINKSLEGNSDYNVSWELQEQSASESNIKNSEETSLTKEEVTKHTQNNLIEDDSVDGEEDIGSPIQ